MSPRSGKRRLNSAYHAAPSEAMPAGGGGTRVMASSFKEPLVVPARLRQTVYLGRLGHRYRRGDFSYDFRRRAGRKIAVMWTI
jgi:hypothetical protein